ncbi:MAG: Mrp/NBP35 family ATP-binding protein [Victivallaceae bacterium]|nr:Mrp/NBP35 family ATP-binding protein [Victivallaceae bacterium]
MAEHQCDGHCEGCASKGEASPQCKSKAAMAKIKRKIVVMSGKGGVGKSTVAANLAVAMAMDGLKVGLLDVDIHGPSIPRMLGADDARPTGDGDRIDPVVVDGIELMSIGFLLESTDSPVVWRGPVKMGVIQQFLGDVNWGELDCLVVDVPPGTGDEPLSVCQQFLGDDAGAIVVTTPQDVSADDVSKSLSFCRQLGFKVYGIIENMSGFVCPHCGKTTEIFKGAAGERLAKKFDVPFLGRIPIDPEIGECGDSGIPFVRRSSAAAKAFGKAVEPVI